MTPASFLSYTLHISISYRKIYHRTVLFPHSYPQPNFVHYYISALCAGRRTSFPFALFTVSYSNLSAAITYPLISMAPKRKATDAGSSSSPLKKRNAVTAGIGRAAEPESNSIGFGYYGRTDDREDVSKTVSLSPCSLCSVVQPQSTPILLIPRHISICSDV